MKLKTGQLISEQELRNCAAAKKNEAECLLKNGYYSAAIYVGGYAVECLLKVAICHAIKQTHLTPLFKTHDLEGLAYHSGLSQDLDQGGPVKVAFSRIVGKWNDGDGNPMFRYNVSGVMEKDAMDFLRDVGEVEKWLVAKI